MKIYLLITNSRCDGGNESISVEPYENEADVRKAFKEAIDDDVKNVKASGWETETNDDSYESFEPGYEMQNHYSVSIRTVELKGNYRVRTVCGADLISELEENNGEEITIENAEEKCLEIGCLCERVFDTVAELDAYEKGRNDQNGWENCEDGDDYPEITDEVWEKYGNPDD